MKNSEIKIKKNGGRGRWAILLLGLCVLFLERSLPAQIIGVSADIAGTAHYPDNGSGSVGGESQVGFGDHSGFVAGFASATALIHESASGVDGSGTSGSILVDGFATASIGVLHAAGTAQASSTPPDGLAPFPHADASLNFGGPPVAQFWDMVTLFNPDYPIGANLPASITIDLDWSRSFRGFGAGTIYEVAGASGSFGVAGLGSVGSNLFDNGSGITGNATQTLSGFLQNGVSTQISGSLTVYAATRVYGLAEGTTSASATSDAGDTAHFYIDSFVPGTTITDANGYDYAHPTDAAAVPEVNLGGRLAFALLAAIGIWKRRTELWQR